MKDEFDMNPELNRLLNLLAKKIKSDRISKKIVYNTPNSVGGFYNYYKKIFDEKQIIMDNLGVNIKLNIPVPSKVIMKIRKVINNPTVGVLVSSSNNKYYYLSLDYLKENQTKLKRIKIIRKFLKRVL